MQIPHVPQRTFVYHTPLKTEDTTDLLHEAPSAFKGYSIHHLSSSSFFSSTACHDFFSPCNCIFY